MTNNDFVKVVDEITDRFDEINESKLIDDGEKIIVENLIENAVENVINNCDVNEKMSIENAIVVNFDITAAADCEMILCFCVFLTCKNHAHLNAHCS